MTKSERDELATVVRMRGKVARSDLDARKAALLADFEEQLATEYDINDSRWAAVTGAAKQAVAVAKSAVAEACREAGIPSEFAPDLSLSWYSRGRNAAGERRAELRRVAVTKLDALTKAAKVEIDRAEASLRGEIAARGLSTAEARAWLDRLPSVDDLLPPLELGEVKVAAVEAANAQCRRLGRGLSR